MIFWKWFILAVIHGVISFYIVAFSFKEPVSQTGLVYGQWLSSTVIFSIIIHLVNYKLFLES